MASYKNFIGGKEISLSGKTFEAKSEFYDFSYELADSNFMDISVALSKVKNGREELKKTTFEERIDILNKVSKKLRYSKEDIKSSVMMSGMPIKSVSDYIEAIPSFFNIIPNMISNTYEHLDHNKSRRFFKGINKFEHRIPINGSIYAISPSNDPRVGSVIAIIAGTLGIPVILKTSKADVPITMRMINTLVDSGYPPGAFNVITFDTKGASAKAINFKLVEGSDIIWVFGDDKTVDETLRFERKDYFDINSYTSKTNIDPRKNANHFVEHISKNSNLFSEHTVSIAKDYFAGKTVIRHASGRSAGILDSDVDVKKSADIIFNSSMKYPIGCNSMKSLFAVGESYEEVLDELKKRIDKSKIGDPLSQNTDIGYASKETLDYVEKRLKELNLMRLLREETNFKRLSDIQATPLLCSTNDLYSEFLSKEISAYILCLKKTNDFNQALSELDNAVGENEKLAVSVLTKKNHNQIHKIRAHHIKLNDVTTDLDAIIHEGNDYVIQLTKPRVVHKNDI